jgi:hypothetical protein
VVQQPGRREKLRDAAGAGVQYVREGGLHPCGQSRLRQAGAQQQCALSPRRCSPLYGRATLAGR